MLNIQETTSLSSPSSSVCLLSSKLCNRETRTSSSSAAAILTGVTSRRHPRRSRSTSWCSLSCSSSSPSSYSPRRVGLYIHIPYCRQRCRYCDFAIVPLGNRVQIDSNYDDDPTITTTVASTGTDNILNDHPETTTTATTASKEQKRSVDDGFHRMNQQYISALLKEVRQIALDEQQQRSQSQSSSTSTSSSNSKIRLSSLYFGGGTPSLAPIQSVQTILWHTCHPNNVDAPFVLDSNAEVTMEMDPGTFDRYKLQKFKTFGINRISLGVQSLDDTILQTMGRYHRRHDVYRAIDDIVAVYGTNDSGSDDNDNSGDDNNDNDHSWMINYSIDLISGVPGLTLTKFAETLEEVTTKFAVRPTHLSIYDLQIEKGTTFSRWYDGSRSDKKDTTLPTTAMPHPTTTTTTTHPKLPSEEECAQMYKYAAGYLRQKSYEHYEVSSYAAAATTDHHRHRLSSSTLSPSSTTPSATMRSQHNQIYWDYDTSWYAIGLGASSFVRNKTIVRPKQMYDYLQWVESNTAATMTEPTTTQEQHRVMNSDDDDDSGKSNNNNTGDEDERLADILLKRLRTSDGLDLGWIQNHYGSNTVDGILKGAELGFELSLANRSTVVVDDDDDGSIQMDILRLNDPEGLLFSNYIISSIYEELGLQ